MLSGHGTVEGDRANEWGQALRLTYGVFCGI